MEDLRKFVMKFQGPVYLGQNIYWKMAQFFNKPDFVNGPGLVDHNF